MKIFFKILISFSLFWIVFLILSSSSFSQDLQVWTNLGLYGGQINDIAIDPLNTRRMFVATYKGDGLFLTEDGGTSWQPVEMDNVPEYEGTFKNQAVFAIEIAPSNNNVIWVAHNYWVAKSINGGATWTHISISDVSYDLRMCTSLAIDPTDPDTVYVGTSGQGGVNTLGAIYKTVNGGQTWEQMNQEVNFDFMVSAMDIDPQNPVTIWAVTNSKGAGGTWGGTLYRSGNSGSTWQPIFSLTPFEGAFYAVKVKPDDSNVVFTGSEGEFAGNYDMGILKHYFENNEWEYVRPYTIDSVFALAFDPQEPETLLASSSKSIIRTDDGGDTWNSDANDYHFQSLAVHPQNRNIVFGGDLSLGLQKGVYDSQAKTYNWSPVNDGINAVIVYDVAVDPNESTHLLAGTISGVYEKKTGESWTRKLDKTASSVSFHPTNSRIFYAGLQGRLAKTTEGGSQWTYSNWLDAYDDDHYNFVEDIAINPANSNIIFVAVASGGGDYGEIYKSTDGGSIFTKVLNGINIYGEQYCFNVVEIDPSDPQHIFAGGGNFYNPVVLGDLWESTNGGANWRRTGLKGVVVNALLIDPRNSNVMYAGCGESGGTGVPVYKTNNGGTTWTPSHNGIPGPNSSLMGIWGSSATDVFAVGADGQILHYNGSDWSGMRGTTTEDLWDIWGSSGTDVFAVGNNLTVDHYDGENWSIMEADGIPTEYTLYGAWGTLYVSETDFYTVGISDQLEGIFLNYYNDEWDGAYPLSQIFWDVWGTSSYDFFIVGDIIYHWDGYSWTTSNPTDEWLIGIWGFSATDVFTVGTGGEIFHYNGSSWIQMTSPTTASLWDVWGANATNIFAVGDSGTILRYNGSSWTQMASPTTSNIRAIWGSSRSNIFAVCIDSSILHYDGSSWTVMKAAGKHFNSVTDLEFHPQNNNVIYASSYLQGVFVSPNKAEKWLNLGSSDYNIYAISTGSLYAGTEGGLWQLSGTGVLTGNVKDSYTEVGIDGATISNGMGVNTLSVNGEYMMVVPSGIWDFTATADDYDSQTLKKVTIIGAEVIWKNFSLIDYNLDQDKDGVMDYQDNCPTISNQNQENNDGDATGDACDEDDDNDGMTDDWEKLYNGPDPLVPDAEADPDNDGWSNIMEYNRNTDPDDPNSHPTRALPWLPLLLED